jgi:hypothetical protein
MSISLQPVFAETFFPLPPNPATRQLPDYEPDELPGCSTLRFFKDPQLH